VALSGLIERIRALANAGDIRISEHGYDELSEDGLTTRELIAGLSRATLVEDYPDYPKGPCVLVLQKDRQDNPVHVVWGIPKGYDKPAVLVTAYKPDSNRWDNTYLRRRQ